MWAAPRSGGAPYPRRLRIAGRRLGEAAGLRGAARWGSVPSGHWEERGLGCSCSLSRSGSWPRFTAGGSAMHPGCPGRPEPLRGTCPRPGKGRLNGIASASAGRVNVFLSVCGAERLLGSSVCPALSQIPGCPWQEGVKEPKRMPATGRLPWGSVRARVPRGARPAGGMFLAASVSSLQT